VKIKIEEDEHLMDKVYNNFLSFEYKPTEKKFIENLSISVNITTTTTTTTTAVGTTDSEISTTSSNYKRFFISLMSESLIKKGVFFRLRKRLRVKRTYIYVYVFFFFLEYLKYIYIIYICYIYI
jgi:hypothetical protein